MGKEKKEHFEILLKACLHVMYRVALRLTRNNEDAQDLVSDATVLAWKNFSKLHDTRKFKPWILKIVTNTYISQYRRKKMNPDPIILGNKSNEDEEFSLFDVLSAPFLLWNNNPEKIFLDSLLRQDISRAIDELPDEYRLVITLCELESLPYQEVAKTLNLPIGTVRSRLHRGKSRLQKKLWYYAKAKGFLKPSFARAAEGKGV
ncbi:TPA: RNA polymerase subunit sigma-24 [Patescibacteria group bacterium]|uniref:RNA polymerase, sigma-24 subunit, ECF subfamily n=1 Tax=Candidatus Gottesmanbacteria bacterium GW2011_GWA1_43_11 TaxID=1618436 RepID=A0A0G1ENE3_9BACT|nr:MAG: RNA polymerase, sigma-24 subunit, ECF subfamily [Candidatus Gottesmanbacteria bacterium GW2011_GWA1_43_11]HCS78923.1 RNA polymerase subunit sigma-24 [Patescibacteria group bacterium]